MDKRSSIIEKGIKTERERQVENPVVSLTQTTLK